MVSQDELQDLLTTHFKTYFHDAFLTHAHVDTALTQTGASTKLFSQLRLETGVQEASEARANYDRKYFNPMYARMRIALRINSMKDVTLFFGFKDTLAAPTWGMTEGCAGILIDHKNDAGVPYFYTGNGDALHPNYQATPIVDMDMTRWLIYEFEDRRFRYYSLPYTVPYFDKNVLPGIKQGIIRKWSGMYSNGAVAPTDAPHHIVLYVKNHTGANKHADVRFIDYQEVHPD